MDIIKESEHIKEDYCNSKTAPKKLIGKSRYPLYDRGGGYYTVNQEDFRFEGCGFNPLFHCPDTDCFYYKYAGTTPHCCHPRVETNLEIGGINRCWGINNPQKPFLSFWNKLKDFFYD